MRAILPLNKASQTKKTHAWERGSGQAVKTCSVWLKVIYFFYVYHLYHSQTPKFFILISLPYLQRIVNFFFKPKRVLLIVVIRSGDVAIERMVDTVFEICFVFYLHFVFMP